MWIINLLNGVSANEMAGPDENVFRSKLDITLKADCGRHDVKPRHLSLSWLGLPTALIKNENSHLKRRIFHTSDTCVAEIINQTGTEFNIFDFSYGKLLFSYGYPSFFLADFKALWSEEENLSKNPMDEVAGGWLAAATTPPLKRVVTIFETNQWERCMKSPLSYCLVGTCSNIVTVIFRLLWSG